MAVLIEKIKQAIAAAEMLDAVAFAQELIDETRRLGLQDTYYVAEMLSLIGNVQAERGFPMDALETLADADAEWARHDVDDPAKTCWLARNSQYRAMALRSIGRHAESIESSKTALRKYRAGLSPIDDPAEVTPEEALELIEAVAAAIPEMDAESAEMLGTISIFLVRVCSNIAQALLAQGEMMPSLPWLEVVYEAIERVDPAQRPFVHIEASAAHQSLFGTWMLLARSGAVDWTEEENMPLEVQDAIDRLDVLGEKPIDLSHLPGARSFDTRFLLVQTQSRSGDYATAHEELKTMLADFGNDVTKRAGILVSMARIELETQQDLGAAHGKIVEALDLAAAMPPEGNYLLVGAQSLLAEVCLRRNAFDDARRWASASLAGMMRLAEPPIFDPLSAQLLQVAGAYRGLGNAAAGVFFAKLAAGATAGIHRTLERVAPLLTSEELPSGHEQAADRLRGYLIEDGRLGEALTAGLLPTRGPLPPTTPSEGGFAERFLDRAKDVEEIDAIATGLAEAEARHINDLGLLQRQELERFRDVIPWDDATTFLHYNPLPDFLQVVIATSDRAETWNISVGAQELAKCAFEFLDALVAEKAVPTKAYDLLIRPLEEQLGGTRTRRLVIAGGDFLGFLPFAALYDGRRYLVERYATISWSPAATPALKQLPSTQPRLALLGYERGAGTYGPLWSVPDELRAITEASRSDGRVSVRNPPFAIDARFTVAALSEAIGGGADVLHLATHFEADPADAHASRLVLGNDTLVGLGELSAVAAGGSGLDLVTLAACSTGLPAGRAADANVSAAAVLHTFGVRSVASTLWAVRSSSTAILMDRFYRGLFATEPLDKAESLRQAQLALLHGTARGYQTHDEGTRGIGRVSRNASANYFHPHHWAPFVLSGNWLSFPCS